jgi:hypothetical protein
MKISHIIPKVTKLLSALVIVLLPVLVAVPVYAASATVSLVSSGSAIKGNYVTVTIRENSGAEPVNGAGATLSYPADKLTFVSIASSSAFGIAAASSGGGGSVKVDRGALSPVTGTQTVATVTFRALTDSGSATVNVTSASVFSANSNTDIASGSSGTTIAFRAPTPVAPPPPADTTPPTITNVKVSEIKANSATISWTTSEPSTTEVNYGTNKSYGLTAVSATPVTEHKIVLTSALMEPGEKYHYMVRSVDPAGNAVTGEDASFKTTGATLVVTVLNQDKKPLSGAKVEIDGISGTTDKKGVVTLSNVTLGKKYGVITYGDQKFPVSVQVDSVDKPTTVTYTEKIKSNNLPLIIAGGLLLLAIVAYLIIKGGKIKPNGLLPVGSINKLKNLNPLKRIKSPPSAAAESEITAPPAETIHPTLNG